MSESTETAGTTRPRYTVTVRPQQSEYHLHAELPGGEVGHVVRSLDDMAWVEREMRSVVAAHLGVPDDVFDLSFEH